MKTIYLDILAKLYESSDASFEKTNFSTRHLEERLVSTFKRKLNVISLKKNCQTICWSFFYSNLSELETEDVLLRAAVILRNEILNIKANKLPDKLTSNDLITGECSIPKAVNDFF